TSGIADHGHCRNRTEPYNTVRSIFFNGVNGRASDDFAHFSPFCPHKTTFASSFYVFFTLLGITDNILPRLNRIIALISFSFPQFIQIPANVRILHPDWTVCIPGKTRTSWASAWLVLGKVISGTWVICLLYFRCDNSIFYVNFPAARTRTVYTMCRTYNFVMLPSTAIYIFCISRTWTFLCPTVIN